MRLNAEIDGARISPGALLYLRGEVNAFITVEDVPADWRDAELQVKGGEEPTHLKSGQGRLCRLGKASFWRRRHVTLSLWGPSGGDAPLTSIAFGVATPGNRTLARAATGLLVLAGVYMALALPQVVSGLEQVYGWGVGGVTLGALVYSPMRDWLLDRLHGLPWALAAFVISLVVPAVVSQGAKVQINRTGDTIELVGGPNDKLDPGEVHAFWGDRKPSEKATFCALPGANGECAALRDDASLPWLVRLGLLGSVQYGCALKGVPELTAEVQREWRRTGRCRPAEFVWQLDDPSKTLKISAEALGPTTVKVACSPGTTAGGTCRLPSEGEDFRLRKFRGASSPMALRLRGDGAIREVFVNGIVPGQTEVIVPASRGAKWVAADVEVSGRTVGHALLQPGQESAAGKCWLIRSGEHLARLVLRGKDGFAQFVAADGSAISAIPLCWSGDLDDVELHLDADWSPHRGWKIELPTEWASASVRIYRASLGYWGTVTGPDRPTNDPPSAVPAVLVGARDAADGGPGASVRGAWFFVELRSVEASEGVPANALKVLKHGARVMWSNGQADRDWLWTGTIGQGEVKLSAGTSRLVHVECRDDASCTARASGPCWLTRAGQLISEEECVDGVRGEKRGFVPSWCSRSTICEDRRQGRP